MRWPGYGGWTPNWYAAGWPDPDSMPPNCLRPVG